MTTIGVFAMIFDEDRRLLCVKMNYARQNWTTPGGRVEPGESPTEALQREVLEESGYRIEVGKLMGVYAKPLEDDLVLSFEAKILSRESWQPNPEISEVRYFDRHHLPSQMSDVVRIRINDAFDDRVGIFRVLNSTQS